MIEIFKKNPQESNFSLLSKDQKRVVIGSNLDQVLITTNLIIDEDEAEIKKKYDEGGRKELTEGRKIYLPSAAKLILATTVRERLSWVNGEGLMDYNEGKQRIIYASSIISLWKVLEGKAKTDLPREQEVFQNGVVELKGLGLTDEQAKECMRMSIQETKDIQEMVGVTENPPEGGLRAIYKEEREKFNQPLSSDDILELHRRVKDRYLHAIGY